MNALQGITIHTHTHVVPAVYGVTYSALSRILAQHRLAIRGLF